MEGDHGRIDSRKAAVEGISLVHAALPGARSAVTVLREWIEKKPCQDNNEPEIKSHPRVFLSSLDPKQKALCTQAVGEHWSIENRNHHKRDASAWQEDRHRHRRPKAGQSLALTRNALLAIIPFEPGQPLAHFFELYHRHRAKALQLILHSRHVL
jgi:predicted transposase YbfD/YdcC